MANIAPQFETEDISGNTLHDNGTVGATPVLVPSSPSGVITEILIENLPTNSATKKLLISFDGGTKYKTLGGPGTSYIWSPKGGLQQVYIKGNVSNVAYEAVINTET